MDSLSSCLGPLRGVYENRWEQGFRQDDSLVRLSVIGRVGSTAPPAWAAGDADVTSCIHPGGGTN